MMTPKTTDLTLKLDLGLYGRLSKLAVEQRRLPADIAEEAVQVYVDALSRESHEQTVEVKLPAPTIQYWRHRAAPIGRSVGEEIAILVLMRTIEMMRDKRQERDQ